MPAKESVGLGDAERAIAAVLAAARPDEAPFAVAVVDEGGDLVQLVRRDGTAPVDVRNAERKAYTAAFIGRDSSVYRQQIAHDGRTVADWSNDGVTTLHGGLTLHRASQVIGGIGVSGTGDEDRDERLALAGAEAMVKPAGDARLLDAARRPRFRSAPGPPLSSAAASGGGNRRRVTRLPGLAPDGSVAPDLVEVGGLFFTSGVRGVDLETGEMPIDPAAQFVNAWRNLRALVEAAGRSTGEIGLVTNFIDSQEFRPHINTGWLELFPDARRPPRPQDDVLPAAAGPRRPAAGDGRCRPAPPVHRGLRASRTGTRSRTACGMGDYVFSSVIVPWDLATSEPVIGEDAQTDRCFDNMRVFMEQAGGTVDDVVLQWVYLNDFAYQPYMVDVYLEAWPVGRYQAARKTFPLPDGRPDTTPGHRADRRRAHEPRDRRPRPPRPDSDGRTHRPISSARRASPAWIPRATTGSSRSMAWRGRHATASATLHRSRNRAAAARTPSAW